MFSSLNQWAGQFNHRGLYWTIGPSLDKVDSKEKCITSSDRFSGPFYKLYECVANDMKSLICFIHNKPENEGVHIGHFLSTLGLSSQKALQIYLQESVRGKELICVRFCMVESLTWKHCIKTCQRIPADPCKDSCQWLGIFFPFGFLSFEFPLNLIYITAIITCTCGISYVVVSVQPVMRFPFYHLPYIPPGSSQPLFMSSVVLTDPADSFSFLDLSSSHSFLCLTLWPSFWYIQSSGPVRLFLL